MVQEITYQAGDILTACDNELQVPSGIMGHSAIAMDDTYIVESVITFPFVQWGTIADFQKVHPKHAVYRPMSPSLGKAAAEYAQRYVEQSQYHYSKGMIVPPYSLSPHIPLEDPWSSIYCSKLVWLSYYYGAGHPFYNDFFLFSPEDLDTVLQRDPNFTLLYKHPEFQFIVDT